MQNYFAPALLCAAAVLASACGSDTPTTPTTTSTSPVTETWSGIVGPGGTASRSFDAPQAGTLTVTLMSSDAPLGVGVGVPRNVNAGCRLTISQVDSPGVRPRGRVELALRVDHGREQRGRQVVVPRVGADDRLVAKRVADPLVPLRLGRDDPRRDPRGRRRGEQQGDGETLHARADASASASACSCRMTSPTHAPRSSYVPVLT